MNMRNAIEQAAYEIGVATAKYQMLVGAVLPQAIDYMATSTAATTNTGNGTRKRGRVAKVATKAADAPQMPKAPVIARGVKKASGPRTKGVKGAIVNLIASGPMTIVDIIEKTGFKINSVIATLAGLKKEGLAEQNGKLWSAVGSIHSDMSGNSDHAADHVNV